MAGMDQTNKHCKTCGGERLAARKGTSHMLHAIASLLTLGLWIPIWILSAIKIGGWRCQTCGNRV